MNPNELDYKFYKMKKLFLTLALIFATGTITNANTIDPDDCSKCQDLYYDFINDESTEDFSTEELQWAYYVLCDNPCKTYSLVN